MTPQDDSLYILDNGVVEVVKDISPGKKPFLRVICGPTYVGEACALGLRPSRTATVRATTVCHVRVLLGHIFRGLLRCFPQDQQRFVQEAKVRLASLAVWASIARQRSLTSEGALAVVNEGQQGSTTSWSQGSSSFAS